MPQSLSAVYVHIVFSTKDRIPFIQPPALQSELHAYLGGICNGLDCPPLIVGGVEDHVHILARQARTITLANWIRDLKSNSSSWMKQQDPGLSHFSWQAGYGAFSVGADGIEQVRTYIRNQAAHHAKTSFQDELRTLLLGSGMTWDEKYLWD